jgi:hypothetical protein
VAIKLRNFLLIPLGICVALVMAFYGLLAAFDTIANYLPCGTSAQSPLLRRSRMVLLPISPASPQLLGAVQKTGSGIAASLIKIDLRGPRARFFASSHPTPIHA